MKTALLTTLWFCSIALCALQAAPPISDSQATLQRDLGLWDDAFVIDPWDRVILRRGVALHTMDLTANDPPQPWVAWPRLARAQFVAGVPAQQRLWLLLNSKETSPFALDGISGQVAEFEIPDLKLPGEQAAVIQSHVIVPHCSAAVLMVSGGDRDSWPRDGNRPVYFWLDLDSGEVVRLPIGWDLRFFSQDQRVAFFTAPPEERFQPPPLQAVEMATGRQLGRIPERPGEGTVPFVWTNTQAVKPVHVAAAKPGDDVRLMGVSVGGRFCPAPERLNATDRLAAAEAFGYRFTDGSTWNVLAGIPRLPDLGPEFSGKDYVHDAQTVRLIAGFGGGERLVLCLFTHHRHDLRSPEVLRFGDKDQPARIEPAFWRRAVVVSSDGQRRVLNLLRDKTLPEQIWLHNSGRLITAAHQWQGAEGESDRKVVIKIFQLPAV